MPQSDHVKPHRGAATNAKREEGGDGGEKGDHGRMCHDDYAKAALYIERNPKMVKSITSFPYIVGSM
jgi:hypothetical protein